MEKTTTTKPKKRAKTARLSHKEKGFISDIIKGETGVQSALKNYDTDDYMTAANIASENLKKPKIIDAINRLLPDELLAKKHLQLLNKTEKKFDSEGNLLSEEPETQAVSKALDMAYKLKGGYSEQDIPTPKGNTTYNFILNQSFKDKIKPLEDELKTQFRNAKPIEEL